MKLIIDIDKDIAQGIIGGKGEMPRNIVRSFQATIADAIKNGTPLSEELEKIKAEIKVNARGEYDFEGYCREEKISIKEVDKIIDNHIKELKGEDNK